MYLNKYLTLTMGYLYDHRGNFDWTYFGFCFLSVWCFFAPELGIDWAVGLVWGLVWGAPS